MMSGDGKQEEYGKRGDRSGTETGARILWLVAFKEVKPATASTLAERLGREESYVRRVCRHLVQCGLLKSEDVPQQGTPSVKVYSVVQPK